MKRFLLAVCSIPLLALPGCGGTSEPTDPRDLAACYAEEFGADPPAGVTHLQARQMVIGDSGGAWLRFTADPDTFTGSVAKRFTSCGYEAFKDHSGAEVNTPSWWKPAKTPTTRFYRCSHWMSATNISEAMLAYDPLDHVVYFHHEITF